MNFYHFTYECHLDEILEQGIRSVPEEERNFFFSWGDDAPEGVVWLTKQKTMPEFYWDLTSTAAQ